MKRLACAALCLMLAGCIEFPITLTAPDLSNTGDNTQTQTNTQEQPTPTPTPTPTPEPSPTPEPTPPD